MLGALRRRKAEVIHVVEIGNKQDESKPHPIYSVVRYRTSRSLKLGSRLLAFSSWLSFAGFRLTGGSRERRVRSRCAVELSDILGRHDIAKGQKPIAKSCFALSVILPRGIHPFPSRTRKLSPAGPMLLHAKVCGRVGRCRHK